MMEVALAILFGVLASEIHVALAAFAKWIVRRQTTKLPAPLRERMQEEWLAEVDACPSHVQKLLFALGLFGGIPELVKAHREQQTPQNIELRAEPGVIRISAPPATLVVGSPERPPTLVAEAIGSSAAHSTGHAVGSFILGDVLVSATGHVGSSSQLFPPSVTVHPSSS